jgi:ribosomal protein S18 acetylase RimI-like enzyme
MPSSKNEIVIDFGMITQDNVEQLRMMNKTTFPISYAESFYKDVVKSKNENLNKFAYHNGFVVGAICTRVEPLPKDENDAADANANADEKSDKTRIYIMTLSVLAAYRNRGIGQKLVQSVIDYHTKSINRGNNDSDGSNNDNTEDKLSPITIEDHKLMQNVQEMALHVQISNKDAIKFYTEKFGFEQGEQIDNYYKRIDPPHCFVLRKKL